ncbi:MAG: 2-oxo acid dehydrogenase subunit E2, partial [Rhodocyclaceae bacterium]|nr:2-oxo acid dehydrogenase subunit E2 [Rhodocyclaceae bacterium]
ATLTISNIGAKGPDWFTAILNAPESAILAVGRTREMPVVRNGTIVARPIAQLTLTVDHRMIDGKLASDFLARVVEILERIADA